METLNKPLLEELPAMTAVQRYLDHALAPGQPTLREVRLRMHGEIKLGKWTPFTADQTITQGKGMLWAAESNLFGLPVQGFDRVVQGYGHCEWKLFGLLPVVYARGGDISKSSVGRMVAESIWNPSILRGKDVEWKEKSPHEVQFALTLFGHRSEVLLSLADSGRVRSVEMTRWGKPAGLTFGAYRFGGYVDEEKTFGGCTIPSRLRIGWHFGTPQFETAGEFFRVTINHAEYR